MLEFCVQHGVNFVTTSAGDPSKYIDKLKNAGITVYHAVPSVEGALKAANCGVDGLVVEGTEGGGFKSPEEVGLFVLIQAIRKQVDLPIIAAGGIADGAGMAAAFAVGAEGIQMGTRFVSSKESPVHENFKNYIFESPLNGTWILNKNSKPVIRALRTDFTKEILDAGEMDMTAMRKIQELYFEGNMNAAPALSGQSVGIIDSIKSVEDIINETIEEFNETCSMLGGLKL
jgi:enoyl-[acyl-carrier protein] reductase II